MVNDAQNLTVTQQKRGIINKYIKIIDILRHYQITDKRTLVNLTNSSWPTIDKTIKNMYDEDYLCLRPYKENEAYRLDPYFAFHLGISIGATQIKTVCCGFDFIPLSEKDYQILGLYKIYEKLKNLIDEKEDRFERDFFCFKRKDDLESISKKINDIISIFIDADENTNKFHLISIGISFPGIIDPVNLRLDFSPNIKCLQNVSLPGLINTNILEYIQKQGISLSFEHDSQAAAIYEKEYLYLTNDPNLNLCKKENIACVYIGTGVGLGLIMNQHLFRGSSNSIGEIGHIRAPKINLADKLLSEAELADKKNYIFKGTEQENITDTDLCNCGKSNCLEQSFRREIFNSNKTDEYLLKTTVEELKEFDTVHPYRYRILKEYIGYILNILINLFNVDLVIFSGRIVNGIPKLIQELETLKLSNSLGIPSSACKILRGSGIIYSAAIGAAISSYYNSDNGTYGFRDIYWSF